MPQFATQLGTTSGLDPENTGADGGSGSGTLSPLLVPRLSDERVPVQDLRI